MHFARCLALGSLRFNIIWQYVSRVCLIASRVLRYPRFVKLGTLRLLRIVYFIFCFALREMHLFILSRSVRFAGCIPQFIYTQYLLYK